MIKSKFFGVWLMAMALALPGSGAGAKGRPGAFDYWSLVLSWSPSFCLTDSGRRDRQQCGPDRAYAFVVHGLWPQYERGWPQHCARKKSWVPRSVIAEMRQIMPSHSLVIHEWRKHGTCSGLSPQAYYALTRDLFAGIRIPERYRRPNGYITTTPRALKQDFLAANPQLDGSMIAVQCGNRRGRANLRDLRICFGRDLKPRRCGANERRACRAEKLTLPPVRPGRRLY